MLVAYQKQNSAFPNLIPVRPIASYDPHLDEQMVPVAQVPVQDIAPWQEALESADLRPRSLRRDRPAASREAAVGYVSKLSIRSVREPAVRDYGGRPNARAPPPLLPPKHSALKNLSPEKRQLLAARLKQRTTAPPANPWFPSLQPYEGKLRLFCFPHAGGGSATFHGWAQRLPASVAVCPVRLPGRESRLSEAPFLRMPHLVEALVEAIRPYTAQPFSFFGHSMGAGVAFELARALRRLDLPAPRRHLRLRRTRAPQFRRNWSPPPDPSDSALLDELRRLEGVPPEVLDNPEVLRVVLPSLRADAALYRNYVYEAEPPLSCSLHVYGGTDDPNITREHLQGWNEQTTAACTLRLFPGGHFFLQTAQADFLAALAADLQT